MASIIRTMILLAGIGIAGLQPLHAARVAPAVESARISTAGIDAVAPSARTLESIRVPGAPVPKGGISTTIDASVRVANIPSSMVFDIDDVTTPPYQDHPDGTRYVYYYVQVLACESQSETCVVIQLIENCGLDGCESCPIGRGQCTRREFVPEQMSCLVAFGQSADVCELTIENDRTTYAIHYEGGLAVPQNIDIVNAFAYYIAGQASLVNDGADICVPIRYDEPDVIGGLSLEDPGGDVRDGNGGCNEFDLVSEAMDQAVDLRSVTVSVETDEPPVEDRGIVVLGLSAGTPGPLAVGDPISYTLRLSNGGGSMIRDAFCSAEGPSSRFRMEQVSCDGASIDGAGVFWDVGDLQPGQGMTCTFSGRVTAPDPDCAGNCELTLQAGAQFVNADSSPGSLSTRAVVGTLAPPSVASTLPGGAATTRDSSSPSLSADGRIVAFSSYEKALVGGNANGQGADIYLRDGDGIRLISRTPSGQLDGDNRAVDVALNGRAAAFVHEPGSSGDAAASAKGAANSQLCASQPNSLFQMDCDTTGGDGAPLDGDVESPSMSADGKLVAFCSSASNWVAGDTNGAKDVFVKDQNTSPATVTRVSTTAAGEQADGASCDPMISGNGGFVVFTTRAANLGGSASVAQVVRKDLASGALTVITQNGDAPANADAGPPSISADGERITFASRASNLVDGVANGARNVFVFDAATPRSGAKGGGSANSLFVMRGAGGQLPNGDSGDPKLACGGNALSVTSDANNLVPGDSNGVSDYFVYGLDTDRVVRPAPAATGEQPNGAADNAELDCEARAGAYDSEATNGTTNPNPNADVTLQDDPLRSDTAAIVLDDSYSGNWYNPGQSGHGFLLEALPNGTFYATWYVYENGQPLFLQGQGVPAGNRLDVDMYSVTSTAFPVGPGRPTVSDWGRVTFTFTSSNDGMASWQPVAAGFTAGSTTLRRLSNASRIESDRDGVLSACYSGIWYDRDRSGFGFDVEFNETASGGRIVQAFWYTYQPDGSPLWLIGVGEATPGGVILDLIQLGGTGAQFPPAFSADAVTRTQWGTATLTFTPNRLDVQYESDLPGYGSGTLSGLQRLTVLDQRECVQ